MTPLALVAGAGAGPRRESRRWLARASPGAAIAGGARPRATVAPSALAEPARAAPPRAGARPRRRGRRVANVDVLRAVAALGVLADPRLRARRPGRARSRPSTSTTCPLLTLATGVWLFFAISGYVIGRPFVDRLLDGRPLPALRPYARRRAARILPLYWVALTALIAIDGAPAPRGWQFPLHYLLLNNLVPGRQEALFPAAWTLTLEALFYALLPVLALRLAARARRPGPRLAPSAWPTLIIASWVLSIAFTAFADLLGRRADRAVAARLAAGDVADVLPRAAAGGGAAPARRPAATCAGRAARHAAAGAWPWRWRR